MTDTAPVHDVVVVGAGAVGCAVAHALAVRGLDVVVLERGAEPLSGASKANSAILHTGFDAPPGTLEARLVARGHALYLERAERHGLSLLSTGALVVAWNEDEAARLPALLERAHANGVHDATLIDAHEVAAREPSLAHGQLGALLVPREHVIDPWSPFHHYANEARRRGTRFVFDAALESGAFDGAAWTLTLGDGSAVRANRVINCAGLHGDTVERACLGDSHFEIRPRAGQFVVFDKAAARHVGAIVLPVPNEITKGVVLTRTAFGNVLVGPTAEEQSDRERAVTTTEALRALVAEAARLVPALADVPVTATYAGLRPGSEDKRYRLRHEPDRHWLTVGGIRSTGMTSSLGLAEHVTELLLGEATGTPVDDAPRGRPPVLSEHEDRDWQTPGYGEIVCHCELVTRREIEAALDAPVPARSLAGIRRRTRCGLGRCQGFNCAGRLAELTDGRLVHPVPGAA